MHIPNLSLFEGIVMESVRAWDQSFVWCTEARHIILKDTASNFNHVSSENKNAVRNGHGWNKSMSGRVLEHVLTSALASFNESSHAKGVFGSKCPASLWNADVNDWSSCDVRFEQRWSKGDVRHSRAGGWTLFTFTQCLTSTSLFRVTVLVDFIVSNKLRMVHSHITI